MVVAHASPGTSVIGQPAPASSKRTLPRLTAVDVLRGIAALMVLLYHTRGQFSDFSGVLLPLKPLAEFGWSGVGLFLVVSGFSIHFRWAASDYPHHHFTRKKFFTRRFFRLYPTYLAVALITIPLLVLAGVGLGVSVPWVVAHGTMPSWAIVGATLLLVTGNLAPIAYHGVAWSLALETQLYVVYGLVVSRLRKIGVARLVCATLVLVLAYRLLSELVTASVPVGQFLPGHRSTPLSELMYEQVPARAFEWFLGVLAAEAFFGRVALPRWTRSPWIGLLVICVAAAMFHHPVGLTSLNGHMFHLSDVLLDPMVGLGYFVLLQWLVAREHRAASPGRLRLAVVSLATVGVFSYSLYLLHPILLLVGGKLVAKVGIGGTLGIFAVWAFVLAFAWTFNRIVELPFITGAGDRWVLSKLRSLRKRAAVEQAPVEARVHHPA